MAEIECATASDNGTRALSGARAPFAGSGEMCERCRALDWSLTPLGPVDRWPQSLRTAVQMVLASPFPSVVLWGSELVQIYNDGCRPLVGAKHPAALGRPARESWPEVWCIKAPIYERVRAGESVALEDELLRVSRSEAVEDAWFTVGYSPIRDDAGAVAGVLVSMFETTDRRRTELALRKSEDAARARLAELEAIYDSAPIGLAVLDLDLRFLRINERLAEINGVPAAAHIGRTPREIIPSVADAAAGILRRVLETGEPVLDIELVGETAAQPGVTRTWIEQWLPVRDGHGRVTAISVVAQEVTAERAAAAERERLLAALVVERARLATVFAETPSMLALLRGPDHVFELANDAYLQLIGRRDVIGRPVFEAVPELRGQGLDALLDRVLATGEPFVGREMSTFVARSQNGEPEEGFFDFEYLPWAEADGSGQRRVTGIIAHGIDVTEQVRARREVERLLGESERARTEAEAARREAEAANRAKGEFLAVMSHELRTPLNAIGGYAELMELGLRGPITEQQRADLARIQASQRHLLGLINQVLNYTRIDAGAVRYDLVDIPIAEALAAAEALVLPQVHAKGLAYATGSVLPTLAVRADREKLQQILLNLLGNAIKFTDIGGEVRVTCTVDEATIAVGVADTGVGIAPEKLATIFDPFVQVDQRLTRPHEGVGLGLAIARDLAGGMGGDLTVESAVGEGSVFTLTLPRADDR